MTESQLDHPAIQRLRRVAKDLDGLLADIVFIGGSIAPLLQIEPPFGAARPTKDVDGVIASARYADVGSIQERMRQLGFSQLPGETAHMHRWKSPSGDLFDLVPAGSHHGGSGQQWDRVALETSKAVDLGNGIEIRHASAPAFLALKWAAHADRGTEDPYASHDLEDILALVASRKSVVGEIAESPKDLKAFVVEQTAAFLRRSDRGDILAGHLNNAQDPSGTAQRVLDDLMRIAAL